MVKQKKLRKLKKLKDYSLDENTRAKKKKARKGWIISLLITLILIFALSDLILARLVFPRQTDDLTPGIKCESELLNKTDVFMVIPFYNKLSLTRNMSWCKQILSMNKTLGMHGVYHTYKEFNETRNESYIKKGMEEFKKCFGFYPKIFEAPQLVLNDENK